MVGHEHRRTGARGRDDRERRRHRRRRRQQRRELHGRRPSTSPITLTQQASINTGGMSTPLAFPANNVAGNFIMVAARARFADQTFTVSDARSNVYRRALTVNNGTDDTLAIYYAENIAAGPNTVTVAVSTGPASIRLAIFEYAGIARANALDVTATAAGSSASPSGGSATTTAAGNLVIGAFSTQSGRTFTVGSGSTIRAAVSAAPSTNLMVQDRIQATAGAVTATATLNTPDIWGAAIAAFKKASAANLAPTLTQPANQTSAENATISLPLVASDPDGTALTYSATGLPPVLGLNAATGVIAGTLTFASAGTYAVTATVSDGALTDSKTFTWTVSNVNRAPTLTQPANQTSAENTAISLPLAASDPDGTALHVQRDRSAGIVDVDPTTGVIAGTLTSTSAGTYTVTATASDGSLTNSKTFTWTVTDVAPAPSITSLSPTSGTVGTAVDDHRDQLRRDARRAARSDSTARSRRPRPGPPRASWPPCPRRDDRARRRHRGGRRQQRRRVHGGWTGAERHEPGPDERAGRHGGDDHGCQLRRDEGDEHGHLQRHDRARRRPGRPRASSCRCRRARPPGTSSSPSAASRATAWASRCWLPQADHAGSAAGAWMPARPRRRRSRSPRTTARATSSRSFSAPAGRVQGLTVTDTRANTVPSGRPVQQRHRQHGGRSITPRTSPAARTPSPYPSSTPASTLRFAILEYCRCRRVERRWTAR